MTSNFKSTTAVIGSGSMVGSRYIDLVEKNYQLIKSDLKSDVPMDITDENSVADFFKKTDFDNVILFSAFTNVDAAEQQRGDKEGIAYKINVEGPINIAEKCQELGKKLIFISTDFVFDGTEGPYDEASNPGPDLEKVSWYGITKMEAEKAVAREYPDAIIVRIAYPYRGKFEGKDDFFKKTLKMFKDGKLYPMFKDQELTPTFIDDLAIALPLLLEKKQTGTFHIASLKVTTPYDVIKKLIEKVGGDPSVVKAGSIVEFLSTPGATPRPIKGGLSSKKIQELGFIPTSWDDGIEEVFKQSEGELI